MSLLNTALQFASNCVNITDEERHIILYAKKSLKSSSGLFDVTMVSFDGAETCELVGAYLLHNVTDTHDYNFGLYRDDRLGITKAYPHQTEKIKKNLCDIFSKHGLKITIKANKKIINFLDVSLNLSTGTHTPFNKHNIPLYIKQKSNHTPRIIGNIRQSINRRLSEISYNKESFEKAAPFYQKALDNSSYKHLLTFSSNIPTQTSNSKRKNRKRDVIWYNPPFSKNIYTNIEHTFL